MTNNQESQGFTALPSSYPSPAIVDVADNLRAKIYSIFCKIGELKFLLSKEKKLDLNKTSMDGELV